MFDGPNEVILDFVPKTGAYLIRVPRSRGADIQSLMMEHGLDLSLPASTTNTAVLFTHEPYAAASFVDYASAEARRVLAPIITEIEASRKIESGAHIKCPPDQELWNFQKSSLEYALRRNNTLVGDQPGLGKTPIAICYANEISAKRVLVICPANIRLQWVQRIRQWTTMRWPYTIHAILNSRHGVHPTAQWTVVSYDLARTEAVGRALARGTYDLLILDEAHYLKTIDSRRTRAVFGGGENRHFEAIASRCGSILGLTGTPLPNRPREAYTLARGMCLGAATRVLTDSGVKAIVDVTVHDQLWDGEAWVRHAGVIAKGIKPVMGHAMEATGDHRIKCGGHWSTWRSVLANASIRSHASATGWASLQSLATLQGKAEFASLCRARVEALLTRSPRAILETGAACAAKRAETECSRSQIPGDMPPTSSPMLPYVNLSSGASATLSGDAKSQSTPVMQTMAGVVSAFGPGGLQTAPILPGISPVCQHSAHLGLNWTELTTTKDMSPEISDGFLSPPTTIIDAPFPLSPAVSTNLKHVYDIVNAGPRQRFTVLTDMGPLVVHNCFDSIDWLSEDAFRTRFNPSRMIEKERADGSVFRVIDERSGRHAELQNRLRANFMTRHLKREVMPWLKMPAFDIIQLEETSAVKQALKAESLLDIDPEDLEGADAEVLGHVAVVRRQMGLALAPQVADYIDMLIEGGEEKLVVFGWHIEVLDILENKWRKHGVVRIDGSTTAVQRQKRVDEFIKNPKVQIILGNIQSMGVGVDGLQQVAWHALIAEPDWTPGNNIQAFDRLDRGGQTNTVQGDIFVAPGSFAERVLASALRKLHTTHRALDKRTTL